MFHALRFLIDQFKTLFSSICRASATIGIGNRRKDELRKRVDEAVSYEKERSRKREREREREVAKVERKR